MLSISVLGDSEVDPWYPDCRGISPSLEKFQLVCVCVCVCMCVCVCALIIVRDVLAFQGTSMEAGRIN